MTKNKAMRLGSVMLVLALLTTCAISGTFAKYTAEQTATDNARVAYWGWQSNEAVTFDLFGETENNVTMASGVGDNYENVIAPGTANSTDLTFEYNKYKTDKITAPEVGYDFTVAATSTGTTTNLDANKNFKWVLTTNGTDVEYDTIKGLTDAISNLSASGVSAGSQPSTIDGKTFKVGWKWLFDDSSTGAQDQDELDTTMGNADELEGVTITITTTVTQKD